MEQNDQTKPKQLKGFYGKVKVSVRALDILIIIGVVALFGVLAFGLNHRGFTIDFDTNGGTHVESQKKMYGDHIDAPENPTREGYDFLYWSLDDYGRNPWDMEEDVVEEPMKLYAIWQEKE